MRWRYGVNAPLSFSTTSFAAARAAASIAASIDIVAGEGPSSSKLPSSQVNVASPATLDELPQFGRSTFLNKSCPRNQIRRQVQDLIVRTWRRFLLRWRFALCGGTQGVNWA
jgi:hypothetical protein